MSAARPPRIALRADASAALGLGHLRRTISLALALRELGAETRLAAARSDVDVATFGARFGLPVDVLEPAAALASQASTGRAPEHEVFADAHACRAAWADWAPDAIVVDHYSLDARWHDALRAAWQREPLVAAIDDLADRPLAVDLLVDHNLVPQPGHRARYAEVLVREPQRWCTGPRHALLDPVFRHARPIEVAEEVRSIGIFMGGTDPGRLSLPVWRACRAAGFKGPIEIAATSMHPQLAGLQAACEGDRGLLLSLDQPDLCDFFGHHDLQVGAGGGASWERCRLGVPSLTLAVADNQRAVIPALAAQGAIETVAALDPASLTQAIAALLAAPSRRRQLAAAARALVDGRGAERVSLALLALRARAVQVRAAQAEDAERLWQWRNDPATRAVSRDGRRIDWAAHRRWFDATLADPHRRLWIGQVGPQPVGAIRFDALIAPSETIEASTLFAHEVSLYLDPQLHGLGLGAALLDAGERALRQSRPDARQVQAEVLPGNMASHRLFLAAGYRAVDPTHYLKSLESFP